MEFLVSPFLTEYWIPHITIGGLDKDLDRDEFGLPPLGSITYQ